MNRIEDDYKPLLPLPTQQAQSLIKFLKWPAVLVVFSYLIILTGSNNREWVVDHNLILEYIRTLAWPILAYIALRTLRPYLPNLINRVKEAGAFGTNIKFETGYKQEVTIEAEELASIEETASVEESPDDEIDPEALREVLTSADAKLAYEQIYRDIFGTQLDALKRLDAYREGLLPKNLEDLLNEHQKKKTNPYLTIITFMQYLVESSLALHEPETDLYKLTNAGAYFLMYLRDQGVISRIKPF